ncbi:MAG TPA: hypothetical protein ENJ83_01660 [Rhodospirillales bacterium]|nr:hypothetical protein [Rhodospirillales bacterium]
MRRPKRHNRLSAKELTNEEVVVLAVAMLGGKDSRIGTEDIAVKSDEIAPERFRWRKYPRYINNELVHAALRDAKRLDAFLEGSSTKGWQLTPKGQSLVEQLWNSGNIDAPPRPRLDSKERAWVSRERSRLFVEDAFRKIAAGNIDSVTRQEAERFFRIDEYIVGEARERRLQRIRKAFGNDPNLGPVIEALITKLEEK